MGRTPLCAPWLFTEWVHLSPHSQNLKPKSRAVCVACHWVVAASFVKVVDLIEIKEDSGDLLLSPLNEKQLVS